MKKCIIEVIVIKKPAKTLKSDKEKQNMVLTKRVLRQEDYLNFNKRVGPNKTVLVGKNLRN